jgi:hypothetical protein
VRIEVAELISVRGQETGGSPAFGQCGVVCSSGTSVGIQAYVPCHGFADLTVARKRVGLGNVEQAVMPGSQSIIIMELQ